MKVIDISVEVSGKDSWGNTIAPYTRNINSTIAWSVDCKIGTNHLERINTEQVETILWMSEPYEKKYSCNECMGWGCKSCCGSVHEIRSKQGIFS